jgi:hypothetical protein
MSQELDQLAELFLSIHNLKIINEIKSKIKDPVHSTLPLNSEELLLNCFECYVFTILSLYVTSGLRSHFLFL